MPSWEEWKEAFLKCDCMKGRRVKLLKRHFDMPRYCCTMTQLAKAVGYKNFNAGNLQYGSLAKCLVKEMGWESRISADLSTLVVFYAPPPNNGFRTMGARTQARSC